MLTEEGKNRQNAATSNVNEEITTVNDDFETATELLNEGSAACPSCTCECGATDLSSREMGINFKAPDAKAEEKFVDLLDIYNQNQSDLDNGIFNDGMLFTILRGTLDLTPIYLTPGYSTPIYLTPDYLTLSYLTPGFFTLVI